MSTFVRRNKRTLHGDEEAGICFPDALPDGRLHAHEPPSATCGGGQSADILARQRPDATAAATSLLWGD